MLSVVVITHGRTLSVYDDQSHFTLRQFFCCSREIHSSQSHQRKCMALKIRYI